MFLAHLPAGYLLTRHLQRKLGNRSRVLFWVGLATSIFPDIDLLYFYLIDNRQTLHHHYITHLPMAWLGLAILTSVFLIAAKKTQYIAFVVIIFANAILHMALDSVAADIDWLYPFADGATNLVQVPAKYSWWVWNFFLHWTFGLELLIILAAFWTWTHHAKNHTHRR